MASRASAEDLADVLFQKSKAYRAELENFIHKAASALERNDPALVAQLQSLQPGVPVDTADLHAHLYLIQQAGCIWHLCEVFWLDPHDNVTLQLLGWLHKSSPLPDADLDIWTFVERLAAQGRLPEVSSALRELARAQVPSAEQQVLEAAACLADQIPSTQHQAHNAKALVSAMREWRARCQQFVRSESTLRTASGAALASLFRILLAEEGKLRAVCQTWQEFVVCMLLFRAPQSNKVQVAEIAIDAMQLQFPGLDEGDDLYDRCCQCIVTGQLYDALTICQEMDMRWFTAHLTDLLAHAGNVQVTANPKAKVDVREALLLDFASTLMFHPAMWQVGADYLLYCPAQGPAYTEKLVMAQPLTSDRVVLKLAHICDKLKLYSAKLSLYTRWGLQAQRASRYGSAIHWLLKAVRPDLVAALCMRVLANHFDTRDEAELCAVAAGLAPAGNVASSSGEAVIPEALTIAKWRDFCVLRQELHRLDRSRSRALKHKSLEDVSMEAAEDEEADDEEWAGEAGLDKARQVLVAMCEIVVRLLCSNVAPRRWWFSMMVALLPLLAHPAASPTPLSVRDTHSLMARLHEVSFSQRSSLYLFGITRSADVSTQQRLDHKRQESKLRLALVRNLSKAVQDQTQASKTSPQCRSASS